ncbi:hypothetical protein U1Q18_008622 [Sarracenia purpurea var. burkii]
MQDLDHLTPSEMVAHNDDKERSQTLASHGAMLLQSALAEMPIQTNDGNESQRKPLSEIGNTMLSALLSDIGLNIREPHVFSTTDGYSLDVFVDNASIS